MNCVFPAKPSTLPGIEGTQILRKKNFWRKKHRNGRLESVSSRLSRISVPEKSLSVLIIFTIPSWQIGRDWEPKERICLNIYFIWITLLRTGKMFFLHRKRRRKIPRSVLFANFQINGVLSYPSSDCSYTTNPNLKLKKFFSSIKHEFGGMNSKTSQSRQDHLLTTRLAQRRPSLYSFWGGGRRVVQKEW